MIKLKVFSVYDSKAAAYMTPFFLRTEGEAVRSFMDEVNRSGSGFNAHPEDFVLMLVGDWDAVEGSLIPTKVPTALVTALAAKAGA